MRGLVVALVVVLAAAVVPPRAEAGGVDLYEPFPEPRSGAEAGRFVERLPGGGDALRAQLSLSPDELRRGVFPSGDVPLNAGVAFSAPLDPGPASARAGVEDGFRPHSAWALVPLLLVVAVGAAALFAMRRTWAPVALGLLAAALVGLVETDHPPRADDRPSATPGRAFFGILSDDVIRSGPAHRRRTLARQQQVGFGTTRQVFAWKQIERRPGRFRFRRHDAYVRLLAEHGMEVMPILFDPPRFHSGRPARGARRGTYPPRDPADMGRFARALAERYGPRGSFWAENRDVPYRPVRSWQVWNEPNLRPYWPDGPSAREYTRLLRVTGRALKDVDPKAEVITAGLPNSRSTGAIPFERYVSAMYRAGARGTFDALAVHPYAREADAASAAVLAARNLMDRHGDDSPIWLTELGWASDGPPSAFTVGERGQAARLRQSLVRLARERHRVGLRGVVIFNWRDPDLAALGIERDDFWGFHTGLVDAGGREKPAARAVRRAIAELR